MAMAAGAVMMGQGAQLAGKKVRHVILWKLKESVKDKAAAKAAIKSGLEGLKGKVPGLIEVNVYTNGLPESTADLLLDSTLESVDALNAYEAHPAHLKVVKEAILPVIQPGLMLNFPV